MSEEITHPPIFSEPSFCNSVSTADDSQAGNDQKTPMSKVIDRLRQGAITILKCGNTDDVVDDLNKTPKEEEI